MYSRIMITAHSGCDGTPPNSIASIEKGIALGADCVEIDIRRDARGGLWLTHDLPESFDAFVPLEGAFALIRKSGIAVNCDLKEYGTLLPVLELADRCGIGPDQLIFSGSVEIPLLRADPGIARRCRIFLNSEELLRDLLPDRALDRAAQQACCADDPQRIADELRKLNAAALNVPYKYTPPELAAALSERGVPLSLWTLNDEDVLRAYMALDLLNITTRSVETALAIRVECRGMAACG